MSRSTTKRERKEAFKRAGITDPQGPMSSRDLEELLKQRNRNLARPSGKVYRRPAPGGSARGALD